MARTLILLTLLLSVLVSLVMATSSTIDSTSTVDPNTATSTEDHSAHSSTDGGSGSGNEDNGSTSLQFSSVMLVVSALYGFIVRRIH